MAKELPKFKNREEELRFWDTVNVFEYTEPVELKLDLPPRPARSIRVHAKETSQENKNE
jgi:hypothetical protein